MSRLYDRSVLEVSGDEARGFLHGLVTCPVETLSAGEARFGALLTAQGKVLFDFFLIATPTGLLIDCAADQRDGLLKRLVLYRLRAKVTLAARVDLAVIASSESPSEMPGLVAGFADPRLAGLGYRAFVSVDAVPEDDGFDLEARRLALGIPAGGRDFAFGEVFPADANMDALDGVDFKKGCFVGQEVVARMKHRGTARWRTLMAEAEAPLPEPGTPILDGEKSVGTLGTSRDGKGLALVRIDRVAEARRAGRALTAAGRALVLDLPDYATFSWPETTGE